MLHLIPRPQHTVLHSGIFRLDPGEKIPIARKADPSVPAEGYRLTIERDGISAVCSDDAGFFYALKTLEQLRFQCGAALPCLEIEDFPRFAFRCFMIDCARHFRTVEELKLMIDSAAMFKFNKFHWHLTDDQGWRAEIPSLPALTEKGSYRRCSQFGGKTDPTPHGGFYTVGQMKEIVEYCRERFIDVIPEFEMPGHVTSLLAAFPSLSCTEKAIECKTTAGIFKDILCAGNPDTLSTVNEILDSLCEVFPGEYFHIGGDEAPKIRWKSCEKCQRQIESLGLRNEEELQGWFMNTAAEHLRQHGKRVITWNESLNGGNLNDEIIVQHWMDRTSNSLRRAESGGKIIESDYFHYYVDYPYGMTPLKKVYEYSPVKASGSGAENVIGITSPIWSEQVRSLSRMGYQCFPRLCAVAERAWTNDDKRCYQRFKLSAEKLLPMLDRRVGFAEKGQWDLNPVSRAAQTASFFIHSLNVATIKNGIKNRSDKLE